MLLLNPDSPGSADAANAAADVPVVVALDDTLLGTDTTLESLCVLARRRPVRLLAVPGWLTGGLAHFKRRLNELALPEAHTLPYREELTAWLREQRRQGRLVVLATAADQQLADAIARATGLFDRVIASDGATNLAGGAKRDRLVAEFGDRGFDYVGSRRSDCPVWQAARKALIVSPSPRLARDIAAATPVGGTFVAHRATVKALVKEIRVHHWLKNLLIFVPAAAAHRLIPPVWLGRGLLAFAAFSLCASGVYVLNDLLDLTHDREHPEKKDRMVASGQIRPAVALVLLLLLLLGSAAFCARLPHSFAVILSVYFLLMTAYSLRLKDIPVLDVSILALGYVMRVAAGAIATGIELSPWVIAFIAPLFYSFTLIKRCGELLHQISMSDAASARLNGYRGGDVGVLMTQGVAGGYLAVVMLAAYTNTGLAQGLFPHHQYFWGLCALLFYWINYMWLAVAHGRMHHDPVIFSLKDKVSRWLLAAMAAVTLPAIL